MNHDPPRAITLLDGDVSGYGRTSLRLENGRVDAIGAAPVRGDIVVSLHGDRVLPGLINAHDHLQLNNFRRVKFRETHRNVGEWIDDIVANRDADPRLTTPNGVPRDARLWHGALKNLLAGVTTVAHHDPVYPALRAPGFPVSVLADFGWAHSLAVDGDEAVRRSHHDTPDDWPWFIHAGEGVDEHSGAEFARLESLGCLTANARFIHGVAFGRAECRRLAQARAGLIWCPASNHFLFGRTAEVAELVAQGRVALGSDSRLSGSVDLLGELREAHATGMVPAALLESLVTTASAALLCLPDRGSLHVGARADVLILPGDMPLRSASRADVRCVLLGAAMAYGDGEYASQLLATRRRAPILVDGREKILAGDIADFLRRNPVEESGLQWTRETGRAA